MINKQHSSVESKFRKENQGIDKLIRMRKCLVKLGISHWSFLDNVVSSKITNITKGEKHTGTPSQQMKKR